MLPLLFLHLLSAGPSPESPPLVFPLNEELSILRFVVKTNKQKCIHHKRSLPQGLALFSTVLIVVQVLINNKGLSDL